MAALRMKKNSKYQKNEILHSMTACTAE